MSKRELEDEIKRLQADNAWLRAESDGLKTANERCGKYYQEAMAEIAELREAIGATP